eukprot:4113708-Amphidinium_carterae.1
MKLTLQTGLLSCDLESPRARVAATRANGVLKAHSDSCVVADALIVVSWMLSLTQGPQKRSLTPSIQG